MAGRILGPWNPARKATGAADVGAQILFFQNGTTTPTSLYLAYDGTTLSSPVTSATADANGLFATLWVEDDTRVRVRWLDGTGSQVLQVDNVGSSDPDGNANFSRDLGTDGQFQVRGESGVVQLEAGPASPFATGGDLRIGGWAGTALDTLEIDATTVTMGGNYTFPGTVNFAGEPSFNGVEVGTALLAHGTATAVNSIDIPLAAGYGLVQVRVLTNGSSSSYTAQLSSNGGVSYVTTANYDSVSVHLEGAYSKTTATGGTSAPLGSSGVAMGGVLFLESIDVTRRAFSGWIESGDSIRQPLSFALATGGTYDHIRIAWVNPADAAWAVHGVRGL
jgi:hypothetical protein